MSEHSLPIAIASEEEWRVTMLYADEHAAEFGGPSCHCTSKAPSCRAKHDGYTCSEPHGHTGPHIACGTHEHCLAQWPNEFSPSQRAPRSDLGAFLFTLAGDMNRMLAEQMRKEPR